MNIPTPLRGWILPLFLALMSGPLQADEKAIKESLAKVLHDSKPSSIKPSEVPGVYEVVVGPTLVYMSGDGRYLLQGKMIDVANHTDLTEPKLEAARVQSLNEVGEDHMIVFKAKKPKYTVSVFTDIDCGYCRKLHSEIDQYLAEGITVRYLFFPRAGMGSDSAAKAISVWCAKDRNAALTHAKKGEALESKDCDNPVAEHLDLGRAMGAAGTPMIVTERGEVLPGYVPAKQLAQLLAAEKGDKAKSGKAEVAPKSDAE